MTQSSIIITSPALPAPLAPAGFQAWPLPFARLLLP